MAECFERNYLPYQPGRRHLHHEVPRSRVGTTSTFYGRQWLEEREEYLGVLSSVCASNDSCGAPSILKPQNNGIKSSLGHRRYGTHGAAKSPGIPKIIQTRRRRRRHESLPVPDRGQQTAGQLGTSNLNTTQPPLPYSIIQLDRTLV